MIGSFLIYNAHVKGLQQLLRLRGWNTLHDIPENLHFLRRLIMWYPACKSKIVGRSSVICANSLLRSDLAYAGLMLYRPYFSSTILKTQYQLTSFSAENAFRKRQSQNEEPASNFPSLFYQASTSLSSTMCINIVLRKLPLRSSLRHTTAKHVKSNLETEEALQLTLTCAPDLELLLWIYS
jgi:hypothetical protein